jgi:hypothetical protein
MILNDKHHQTFRMIGANRNYRSLVYGRVGDTIPNCIV